ncbi:MAG: hypothetical protein ACTSW3_00610 [Promethearchaeota archaeon]
MKMVYEHFDKRVEGNLALKPSRGDNQFALDPAKGIGWFDKKRLRRLKAFVRLLKRKEENLSKDQELFEKIDELKIIYEDLLNFYHTHYSKFVKYLQKKLPKLDIDSINQRSQEVAPLIEQLEHMHSKLSNKSITQDEYERRKKVLIDKYHYIFGDSKRKEIDKILIINWEDTRILLKNLDQNFSKVISFLFGGSNDNKTFSGFEPICSKPSYYWEIILKIVKKGNYRQLFSFFTNYFPYLFGYKNFYESKLVGGVKPFCDNPEKYCMPLLKALSKKKKNFFNYTGFAFIQFLPYLLGGKSFFKSNVVYPGVKPFCDNPSEEWKFLLEIIKIPEGSLVWPVNIPGLFGIEDYNGNKYEPIDSFVKNPRLSLKLLFNNPEKLFKEVFSPVSKRLHIKLKELLNILVANISKLPINNIYFSLFGYDALDFIKMFTRITMVNPEIPLILYKKQNILIYSRYKFNTLMSQYYYLDNKEEPYGVIIYPRTDHNGAFLNDTARIDKLIKYLGSLKDENGVKRPYLLRIIEAGNLSEINRLLKEFYNKYGKISFLIVGGHGTKDTIQFSNNFIFRVKDWKKGDTLPKKQKEIFDLFEKDFEICLISCSTGMDEGIAQRMSKRAGVVGGSPVVGPSKPTHIKSITPFIENGKIRINIDYRDDDIEKTYVAGVEAPEVKPIEK